MSPNDLTLPEHLNEVPPPSASWWECENCGDYAWVWSGEDEPACACDDLGAGSES